MRQAQRLAAMVGAGALALFLLAGCASDSEDGGSQAICNADWCSGGQTGSLVPACGLTPNATTRGVPASASGIVVASEACGDARLFDALTVRDASGQPIPFSAEPLPNGELLITPASGLTPGQYTVSVQAGGSDDDAGSDPFPDAGVPIGPALWEQTVSVQASMPLPRLFGTVGREQYGCRTVLELRPEAAVLPYLGVLSVDVHVNDGASQTLIATGTMLVQNGVARVDLPVNLLDGLPDGEHTLHIVVRLAGETVPLDTFMMTLSLPCEGASDAYPQDEPGGSGICSASMSRNGGGTEGWAAAACVLLSMALRRRRRTAR